MHFHQLVSWYSSWAANHLFSMMVYTIFAFAITFLVVRRLSSFVGNIEDELLTHSSFYPIFLFLVAAVFGSATVVFGISFLIFLAKK